MAENSMIKVRGLRLWEVLFGKDTFAPLAPKGDRPKPVMVPLARRK